MMKYTPEMTDFIVNNFRGTSYKDMAEKLNTEFGTCVTEALIKGFASRNKLTNGNKTTFKPGHATHNKGKKGVYYKGCEVTCFKKGAVPKNPASL